ncbi:hypothetical protein H4582DRAFT_2059225 [Lactarius indigo]|nr:hypothetical protein H4582DRAFT_2059225 [Lactarius indigo]
MGLIDTLGFCISAFSIVIYLRFLLPHNIIPTISSMLTDAEQSFALAVTIGAVPEMSDHTVGLAALARQLALIRIESHRSPGLLLQIWLFVRTCPQALFPGFADCRRWTFSCSGLRKLSSPLPRPLLLAILLLISLTAAPPLPVPVTFIRRRCCDQKESCIAPVSSSFCVGFSLPLRDRDLNPPPTVPLST